MSVIELARRVALLRENISVISAPGDSMGDGEASDFRWQALREPYALDQLQLVLRKSHEDHA
jgi:hypothetical protein